MKRSEYWAPGSSWAVNEYGMLAEAESKTPISMDDTRVHITSMPVLVLNVHSRCNCRCVMCDIWKRETTTEITAADMDRHRESLRRLRVEWVVLSGGEPLMHSDLSALCRFFRELGTRLTLLTTGLLLARRAEDVAASFDEIIVSLDGPQAVHDQVRRVPGGFDAIGTGVAAIRKLRPEMRITARTTVQKANHAHLSETALAARELGLDGISFLAADLSSEAFNRPLLWPGERQQSVGLTSQEIPTLEREVEGLTSWSSKDENSGFVAESPAKLRKIVAHFRAHLGQSNFVAPKCNAPWVSSVVEADGSVRPCFFHRPIGNLHDRTFEEIVNGEEARKFRNALRIASDPICQKCVCSLYRAEPPRDAG
jgi:MoaA/NifB/PqqE/SkfB family radical SAM enzyme